MKRAILTGATGALGVALVSELIAEGYEVLVLARRGSARNSNIPPRSGVKVEYCDLCELGGIKGRGEKYDLFYHLGWAGTTGASRNDMPLQVRNIGYALDALELAARLGCRCFVGAGSQAEYGGRGGMLTPETPTCPETGYGMAKLAAGLMTRQAAHALGIRHCWVRIVSLYGPFDHPKSMISTTVDRLLAGERPRLTAGEQMWDYLYSGDAASAMRLIGERGRDGSIYVLGSGRARALRDYVTELRDIVSPGAPLGFGELPYAKGQVMHLQADISSLSVDTGWLPKTDFAEGVREILKEKKRL